MALDIARPHAGYVLLVSSCGSTGLMNKLLTASWFEAVSTPSALHTWQMLLLNDKHFMMSCTIHGFYFALHQNTGRSFNSDILCLYTSLLSALVWLALPGLWNTARKTSLARESSHHLGCTEPPRNEHAVNT
ncbi:hypothetical protein COO60DRAFT_838027 [Scenedesmus sp. NREL 46B-D3]|nr:hypothetical protein COO60DRAFT_838027 [Scenedesmus sp. NREL 46B-D3]